MCLINETRLSLFCIQLVQGINDFDAQYNKSKKIVLRDILFGYVHIYRVRRGMN